MAKRPIHNALLDNSIQMVELYERQLKLTRELLRAVEYRIATVKEFVRANYTGDEHAFKALAPAVSSNTGSERRYYGDGTAVELLRTQRAFNDAVEWRKKYAAQQAEVPALREGSTADQVQEVPAASGNTGAHLPDVESEGGTTD